MLKRWLQFLIPFIVLFLISSVPWGELFISPDDVEIVKETDFESEQAIPLKELHFTKKPIPKINIDHNLFREVIINLLSNAIKYNKKNGKVKISIMTPC